MIAADCIIGIDIGSQSVRAIAFSPGGERLFSVSRPTPTVTLKDHEVDYDPDGIFDTVVTVLGELGRDLRGRPVCGIGVASVGESCVVLGSDDRPVSRSIAWFDRRSTTQMKAIEPLLDAEAAFLITGTTIDPTLTLFKLAWLRDNMPLAYAKATTVLMLADWIAFRLCGEKATDPTLASRTFYFDIHRRKWSDELLAMAGFDAKKLPQILPSGTAIGFMKGDIQKQVGLIGQPVIGVGAQDTLCGAFAVGLSAQNILLNSLGTAESVLRSIEFPLTDPQVKRDGYFQGAIGLDRPLAYIFGSIPSSGSAIEWLRRITGNVPHDLLNEEALHVAPGSGGVVFLPVGANSAGKYLDPSAPGAFIGLTDTTTRGALYRAVLEGLAMQSRLSIDGMIGLGGLKAPTEIRMVGGSTKSRLFMSIKANIFGREILVFHEAEASALGAAICGGIAAGLWPNLQCALKEIRQSVQVVEPDQNTERYDYLRESVFAPLADTIRPVSGAIIRANRASAFPVNSE